VGKAMKIIPWSGQPIDRPGVYSNVGISAYHSGRLCVGPTLSSSSLRTIFDDSEADYWAFSPYNPERIEKPENKDLIIGRATHHLLMGESEFRKSFVIRPETYTDEKGNEKPWSGNSLKCKKWLVEAAEADLTVLTPDMVEDIKGMATGLGKLPLVRAGVLNGLIEMTMAWQDESTGIWLLARPDVIPTDSGNYLDLKTTQSVKWDDLVRTVGEYNYQQQAALVAEGHRILFGQEIEDFSFYFVRKTPPYSARMVTLKPHDLVLGEKQNHFALERFVKAFNSGLWAGPGGNQEEVQYLEISERRRGVIEQKLRMEGE
jgi:hypothetical protein